MGSTSQRRVRARELGIRIGRFETGRWNAITDVAGVRVGHTTLIAGDGPLVIGQGPVRTGVTVIVPRDEVAAEPVFAGFHRLNGAGEMTGIAWVEESGLLTTPIGITNTHSVGVVRDALVAHDVAQWRGARTMPWRLPVVTETSDLWLNDMHGFHVKPEHVFAALDGATSGPVAEGCVGGGTGMNCHEFKGGIGTSSRVLPADRGGWTVGVLVQANYGWREHLHIDGVPVGREIPVEEVPSHTAPPPEDGSIIIVVATDAPLLPHQCTRLAQRATIGLARVGGNGDNGSGDLFLAFSTANRGLDPRGVVDPVAVRMIPNDAISPLFAAVADATHEAIVNALCMATIGLARVGGNGDNGSGDLFLAFSTANRGLDPRGVPDPVAVRMLPNDAISPLFAAVADATHEAIVNALCMATTMVGVEGRTSHALPLDRLQEVMRKYHR